MKFQISILLMLFIVACSFQQVFCGDGELLPYQNTDLSFDERASDLVSRLTLEEKVGLIVYSSKAVPRLGIREYNFGNEALHGIVRPGKFTVFPQAIALASTWDPDLIYDITRIMSNEARARDNEMGGVTPHSSGLNTFWSPTVNMARDPRWGRTPETYGEDPFLTSRIGVSFVRGLQGDDPRYIQSVSTPKHYVANNTEYNRMKANPTIDERTLSEYYLAAFKALITEGKAESIMGAYNAVNGVPCNANKWLLTTILRDEWGFDGYVVTDCGAVNHLMTSHFYVKSAQEAAAASLNSGVDLECGGDKIFEKYTIKAIEEGLTTEEVVDRAVYQILRARFRLGQFDPTDMVPFNKIKPEIVGCEAHQEMALKTARESMVLLKNATVGGKPFLPLDKSAIKSIAVVGPNADHAEFGDYSGTPVRTPVSPLQGIRNIAGDDIEIRHAKWVSASETKEYATIPKEYFRTGDGSSEKGLKAEYFDNFKFDGSPSTTRIDEWIEVDTVNKPPDPAYSASAFSVRWSGKLVPAHTGEHSISVESEGAFRLTIDGKPFMKRKAKERPKMEAGQVVDLNAVNDYSKQTLSSAIMLEAGREYDIVMEYSHKTGGATAIMKWIQPSVELESARAEEMEMIRGSDLVIAVMGIDRNSEREGLDRVDLKLPYGQMEYVMSVMKANPNTVVVLVSGSPLAIRWIDDNVPAVLEAWYPGESGGDAIADVLFGNYNPAGRLTMTWHESAAELPDFEDYEISHGRTYMYFEGQPLYPFGYGLSYTTFEYGDVKIDNPNPAADDVIKISFDVTNTGPMDGDEVAQVYVSDVEASVKVPIKKLVGFKRVNAGSGETVHVTIDLKVKDFGFWSETEKKFIVEPGEFKIQLGASSADIRKEIKVNIN